MILRLGIAFGALDAERAEVLAQPRQRPLVQEAGEVVRAVGQQLAAAEPDEQIEVFALDALRRRIGARLGQGRMREPERARVARAAAPGA